MTVASQQGERLNAKLTLKNAKGLRYVVPEMLTCRGHEREEKEKGPSAYFRKFVHRPDEDLVMMIVVMDVYVLYLFIT